MSPDRYLHFGALFISYFVKVGVAYLVCLLLSSLIGSPRKKYAMWLGFMAASLAWWMYMIFSWFAISPASSTAGSEIMRDVPTIADPFLVPVRFQYLAVVAGKILGCSYVFGVLALATVGIWKRVRLHWLLNQSSAPSAQLNNLFLEIRGEFGVRHCELLVLPELGSPATVYWWRPRILLPEACDLQDDNDLMADILHHELLHVARRDYFWSNISGLICQALFFHPAIWQARKQMRKQREMACDLAVVAARPEHRVDYAHTLTRVARLCLPRRHPAVGIDFAASTSSLTDRVRAILNYPEEISRTQKFSRAAACVLLAVVYGFLCLAVQLGLAFAPARQPQIARDGATAKLSARSGLSRRSGRAPVAKGRDKDKENSLITVPTAYRLQASAPRSFYATSPSVYGGQESSIDSAVNPGSPGASLPHPASGPATTIKSIVLATVDAVTGSEKEDHESKRRGSTHLQ